MCYHILDKLQRNVLILLSFSKPTSLEITIKSRRRIVTLLETSVLHTRQESPAHGGTRKENSLDAVFWNVTPYSLVTCYRRFRETFCLCLQGRRMSTLRVEAPCSFEISETICQTTRCRITEVSNPYSHRRENLTFREDNMYFSFHSFAARLIIRWYSVHQITVYLQRR
jgi:hypothetical protein